MSKIEIPEYIAALARKMGKQFMSEQDLADFSRLPKKMSVEAALGTEPDEHLDYAKHKLRRANRRSTRVRVVDSTAAMSLSDSAKARWKRSVQSGGWLNTPPMRTHGYSCGR